MKPLPLSPLRQFSQRYKEGCGDEMCSLATRVVLCKGTIPCQLLFIGEAPGESEDEIGAPFIGPSGKYLDGIVRIGLGSQAANIKIAYTNLVGCLPRLGSDNPKKAGQPTIDQIESCSGRLREFITLCAPKVIICVGTLARDMLMKGMQRPHRFYYSKMDRKLVDNIFVDWVLHPSFMLRQNDAAKSLMKRRAIITIHEAIEEHIINPTLTKSTLSVKPIEDDEIPF